MKIRTVVPTLNNQWLTLGCVHSLRREFGEDLDLVIVDNGSDDETLACFRADTDQPGSGIRVIQNHKLRHYSRSINMGAALPGPWDALLILNNDTILTEGAVKKMAEGLGGLHEVVIPLSPTDVGHFGVSSPKLTRPGDYAHVMQNQEEVDKWWTSVEGKFGLGFAPVGHPYIPQGGYCLLVSRPLWERLGGFDERYELFGEDYDFLDRAMRWTKVLQDRSAYVEHLEHQTVGWLGLERDVRMARARFDLAERRENLREIFSVVIPNFERTDALFEAIDSVIAQRLPHWKLYVVDDGSKDWDRIQAAAMSRYKGHESRIWFFHLEGNKGPGAARNFGLDVARGKYVAFLDSDDVWAPDHLEKHYEAHEKLPSLVMSYSKTAFAWRWFDEDTKRYRYRPDTHPEAQLRDQTFTEGRLERENFIKTSAVVVNGSLLRRETASSDPIRFPVEEDHRLAAEDWGFFRAVAARGDVHFIEAETATTHWSKNVERDSAHHSARINPWADFGAVPEEWTGRVVTLPDVSRETSIVTPTRDRVPTLLKFLDRVPESVPVIVVADGVTSSQGLVPETQHRANMGLVILDKPKGPSFARNRGAEAARSPWAWFLDDDDVIIPGSLEEVEKHYEDADVVIAELAVGADEGIKTADGVFTSAVFVRLEFFQKVGGFDEMVAYAEERDLVDRMSARGARVKKIPVLVAIKTVGAVKTQGVAISRIHHSARGEQY